MTGFTRNHKVGGVSRDIVSESEWEYLVFLSYDCRPYDRRGGVGCRGDRDVEKHWREVEKHSSSLWKIKKARLKKYLRSQMLFFLVSRSPLRYNKWSTIRKHAKIIRYCFKRIGRVIIRKCGWTLVQWERTSTIELKLVIVKWQQIITMSPYLAPHTAKHAHMHACTHIIITTRQPWIYLLP